MTATLQFPLAGRSVWVFGMASCSFDRQNELAEVSHDIIWWKDHLVYFNQCLEVDDRFFDIYRGYWRTNASFTIGSPFTGATKAFNIADDVFGHCSSAHRGHQTQGTQETAKFRGNDANEGRGTENSCCSVTVIENL